MHSIIRHVIRLQCQSERERRGEGGAEGMEEEVVSRASAWTAALWGKMCLERGCVYIKDYVIVEGGEEGGGGEEGTATGSALRGMREMEKRKNNSCSCRCSHSPPVPPPIPVYRAIVPAL